MNPYYGGNEVTILGKLARGDVIFNRNKAYAYFAVTLPEGQSYRETLLNSYTIYVKEGLVEVVADGRVELLSKGDSLQSENIATTVKALQNDSVILIAGTERHHSERAFVEVQRAGSHYKVVKPWGHELWLTGQHPGYAFKQIAINAGFRTSLQYHRVKTETIVLFEGMLSLVYKRDLALDNDTIQPEDLRQSTFDQPTIINIQKTGTPHRMVAETDVLVYEASTPHLDDVVRVQDDKQRQDGRISAEHQQGTREPVLA